jgi:hypothetical protein
MEEQRALAFEGDAPVALAVLPPQGGMPAFGGEALLKVHPRFWGLVDGLRLFQGARFCLGVAIPFKAEFVEV